MREIRGVVRRWVAPVLVACAGLAMADPAFKEAATEAQLRDVVVHGPSGALFVAAYSQDTLLQIDPATNEVRATIPVGRGPAALALSADGTTLACINRLANSVSFVRIGPDASTPPEVISTVDCGEGARAVTGLPDGTFAVVGTFRDEVLFVAPAHSQVVRTIQVAGVPTAVAAEGEHLAVAARVPPTLRLYESSGADLDATLTLPDAATGLAPLPPRRFVVSTLAGLLLVDARRGRLIARNNDIAALDVAVNGGQVYALTDSAVVELNASLEEVGRIELPVPATRLVAGGAWLIALSPAAKTWAMASLESSEAPVAPPAQQAAQVSPEPGVAPPPAQPVATEAEDVTPTQASFRPMPAPSGKPEAQSRTGKPYYGSMLDRRPGRTVSGALAEGFELASPTTGFQSLGAADRITHIKGATTVFEGDTLTLEGDARATVEQTDFSADRFSYNRSTGEMHASGSVLMSQELSEIKADDVNYTIPLNAKLEVPSPLVPAGSAPLNVGQLDATNIRIMQPDRDFQAQHLAFDFASDTGEAENVKGRAGIVYFGATKLRILGPASVTGDEVWVTTCDHDPPHYRIRVKKAIIEEGKAVIGKSANLQIGNVDTPLWWPKWGLNTENAGPTGFDFDAGHRAKLGSYVNVGEQFALTPDIDLGMRLFPTTKEGVGVGLESKYDFTETPASPLFLGEGEFRSLLTTKERGYYEWEHRHEVADNTVLLLHGEQWSDQEFLKDFYYDEYKNRTEPRNFANLTYTGSSYIADATVRKTTNDFVTETERLPEVSFHLIERPISERLYLSYDSLVGYNVRQPDDTDAGRFVNVARLSYDMELAEALNLTPFVETEGTWYSDTLDEESSELRASALLGATLQTRFHRSFPGALGFSGFKHVIVPSITYSYRPDPSMDVQDTPRFDAYDNVYGRMRLESKIANILFGRDAETGEVWQVARLTLYQGNDLWNADRAATDYEIEMDVRPRPWWGVQLVGEHHSITDEFDIDDPYLAQRTALELYERIAGKPYDLELAYRFNARYGDYDRLLGLVYYEDMKESKFGGRLNARLGFSYTETQNRVFNREILYGLDYKLGDKWSVGFEHRYDFERGDLYRQEYEIRRKLHCWEAALQIRERESGTDVGVEFTLSAFPGTRVKF